jgi:hypothetical protein
MGGVKRLCHKFNSCLKKKFHAPYVTNFAIDLIKSKTFLFVHLLIEDGDGLVELLQGEKLNEVMDKFIKFYFPNIRNLISSLKHHPRSQGYLFNILGLKYKMVMITFMIIVS